MKDVTNIGKDGTEHVTFRGMPATLAANAIPKILQHKWVRIAMQVGAQ